MRRIVALLAALSWAAACFAEPLLPARRIVALAPNLAEIAWAAGAGDLLVGAVAWSDYPPQVSKLPRVGDAFSIDDERLAALDPDLVLAWAGGTPAPVVERLRSRGYRVEVLTVSSLDDVADAVEAVGAWAGTPEPARRAATDYTESLAALRRTQAGKTPVRVFYEISARPMFTVGGEQVITEVLALCGGRNVFADLGRLAAAVDLEAVVARDPEAILAPVGVDLDPWAGWPGLAAVRHGNLFAVDGDLVSRPAPRLLAGAEQVCRRLDTARERLSGR